MRILRTWALPVVDVGRGGRHQVVKEALGNGHTRLGSILEEDLHVASCMVLGALRCAWFSFHLQILIGES